MRLKMSKKHIIPEQKTRMINFLKDHPQLYTGKLTPSYTRGHAKALWSELAEELNAIPNGARKEWDQWRKTWVDIKKNTKSKFVAQKAYEKGTGGGPPLKIPKMDDADQKLLEIISPICVTGNSNVRDTFDDGTEHFILDHEDEELEDETTYNVIQTNTPSTKEMSPCERTKSRSPTRSVVSIAEIPVQTRTIKSVPSISDSMKPQHATPRHMPSSTSGLKTGNAKPRVRMTKTIRLRESINNKKQFLQITKQSMNDTKEYRAEKLKIMKSYYDRKTVLLAEISDSIKVFNEHLQELF